MIYKAKYLYLCKICGRIPSFGVFRIWSLLWTFSNEKEHVGLGSDWNFRSGVAGTIFQGGKIRHALWCHQFPCSSVYSVFVLICFSGLGSPVQAGQRDSRWPHATPKTNSLVHSRQGWCWGGGVHILLDKRKGLACVCSGTSFHTQTDDRGSKLSWNHQVPWW